MLNPRHPKHPNISPKRDFNQNKLKSKPNPYSTSDKMPNPKPKMLQTLNFSRSTP